MTEVVRTRRESLRSFISAPTVSAFIAGGCAGAVSRTVVSPLERMKIIFQVQQVGADQAAYRGTRATLVKMWQEEGWRGFLRGNGTNCIRIIPYSAVQFSSYTFYKQFLLGPGEKDLDVFRRLTAGACAGVTSVTATYPLDLVRTRLSIQSAFLSPSARTSPSIASAGLWKTVLLVYKTEGGAAALYRGIVPTVMGVAPYVGLNFAVYESLRKAMTPPGDVAPGTLGKLGCGAMSGAVAQSITYPFDVLRRRFQINTMSGLGYHYNSIWHAMSSIYVKEGIRGYYKGLWPNLLKVAPSMASSWLSYEWIKESLSGASSF